MIDEKLLCCFCLESYYSWNRCFSQLESLNDKKFCDSVPIPIDLVGEIISKEDLDGMKMRDMNLKVNYEIIQLFS